MGILRGGQWLMHKNTSVVIDVQRVAASMEIPWLLPILVGLGLS